MLGLGLEKTGGTFSMWRKMTTVWPVLVVPASAYAAAEDWPPCMVRWCDAMRCERCCWDAPEAAAGCRRFVMPASEPRKPVGLYPWVTAARRSINTVAMRCGCRELALYCACNRLWYQFPKNGKRGRFFSVFHFCL